MEDDDIRMVSDKEQKFFVRMRAAFQNDEWVEILLFFLVQLLIGTYFKITYNVR